MNACGIEFRANSKHQNSLHPHRQYQHCVNDRQIAVQRYISTPRVADVEFAVAVFHRPPNLGAVGQDLDGFQNFAYALGHLLSLRAVGLLAGLPFARAAR